MSNASLGAIHLSKDYLWYHVKNGPLETHFLDLCEIIGNSFPRPEFKVAQNHLRRLKYTFPRPICDVAFGKYFIEVGKREYVEIDNS